MEEDDGERKPHLRLAVKNDRPAIDKQRAADAIRWPLRELAANLLRVVRGAGRSYEIGSQCLEIVEAFQAYREAAGCWPSSFEIDEILSFRGPMDQRIALSFATETILRGSLQMVASRLVGQHTQECAGESELFKGLDMIVVQREKDDKERRNQLSTRRKMPPALGKSATAADQGANSKAMENKSVPIAKRTKPNPKMPPCYDGLKRYQPTEEERVEFRINTVDDLVALANKYLIAAGQWPIGQGGFPTNKPAFKKVVKVVRRFQANELSEKQP